MMIYHCLADYYDWLVKDEAATKQWVAFTQRFLQQGALLELACGSGEITLALNNCGFQMTASDLSAEMLKKASAKDLQNQITFYQADMTDFQDPELYDGILCYCDSINYLKDENELKAMFALVLQHLKAGGWFLFDLHSLDRLKEFEEEYIEEGVIDDVQYQWTIQSDERCLFHHFAFWFPDGHIEQETHVQTVFDPERVRLLLNQAGFETACWTDFDHPGIVPGEKIFIAGRKK